MKNNTDKLKQPLDGLQVVDLTRYLPGPLCTRVLGDYGAEVIKIEDIDTGDPTRFIGSTISGTGSYFRQLNRNKRSIAINLKTKQGCAIVKALVLKSDLLVEGFRPGVMDRLGLGYKQLKVTNKRLVYTAITGYGQVGSYSHKAGHDINYTALSGLLDLSAVLNEPPAVPAVQIADIAGGAFSALTGILMALYARQHSGEGTFVDISMTRNLVPWLTYAAAFLNQKEDYPRQNSGQITGAYACYNIYETADRRYISLGALEPVFWKRFCETVNKPEWIDLQYDRFANNKLITEVRNLFISKKRDRWLEIFEEVDCCLEPVLTLAEAVDHQISRENQFWIEQSHGSDQKEIVNGFSILFSGQPGNIRLSPPKHGEHTFNILNDLGYSSPQIEKLQEQGIVKGIK